MPNDNIESAAEATVATQSTSAVAPKKAGHKFSHCEKGTLFFENYGDRSLRGFVNGYSHASESLIKNGLDAGGVIGLELEMAFGSADERRQFLTRGSNIIERTTDSSISGGVGLEVQTCPLRSQDAINPSFWRQLTQVMVNDGARSWNNSTTGMHVHIDRNMFATDKETTWRNATHYDIRAAKALYGLYIEGAPWKKRLFGRESSRWCENNVGGKIMQCLSEVLPAALHNRSCVWQLLDEVVETNTEKYVEFNLLHDNTVEFRCPKGTLNPNRIAAVCEFLLLFAKYCRTWSRRIHLTNQRQFEKFITNNMRKGGALKDYWGAAAVEG